MKHTIRINGVLQVASTQTILFSNTLCNYYLESQSTYNRTCYLPYNIQEAPCWRAESCKHRRKCDGRVQVTSR
ncbi:hypothetical protein KP509_09G018200 [Ceratopteris richardii]|uniref:Uncharacterized protein n=1 Tax=Ceratopteris richardii TaxID=49495 RepID=A0A8T2U594_CERRI|nr:hypothetical protein KP509_09G018200 [Ceratopteris richardii]